MKRFSAYVCTAAVAALAIGCKKDNPAPTATKTDLLTGKSWKATDIKHGGGSIFALVSACSTDDLVQFNLNKTVVFDEGAQRCTATAPQTSTGSWNFTDNETTLKTTTAAGVVKEETIVTLNSTTLVLSRVFTLNGSNNSILYEVTYTAQ